MEHIKDSIKAFISSKIDEITLSNPNLSFISARIKKGANEYVDQVSTKAFDNPFVRGFITNDKGQVDSNIFDEIMSVFKEMPEQNTSVMGDLIGVSYGKGQIKLSVKQNIITAFLMPNTACITLKEADFKELFDMLVEK